MRGNGGARIFVVRVHRMGCTKSESKFCTYWHYVSFSFSLVMVAVLRAAAMGSLRVGAMVPSLAMVDNSKAMDSSKAPIILLRAMDSRTSTTVAVEREVEVVEVRRYLWLCFICTVFCHV